MLCVTVQRIVQVAAGLFVAATATRAAEPPAEWAPMRGIVPQTYVCYHTQDGPSIDGRLDEEVWKSRPWSQAFVSIQGTHGQPPYHRTRVKMLWTDEAFVIGAELEEPHVWGTLTKHDAVMFQDNDFEVFLDPDADRHAYGELEINALNATWDLFLSKPYRDGGRADNSWEIEGLETAVHVDGTLNDPSDQDRGWSVEISIPWRACDRIAPATRLPPGDGDQWRVNFSRVQWQVTDTDGQYAKVQGRRELNWSWSPQGVIDMHRPERWGYVQFTRDAVGAPPFRVDAAAPYKELLLDIYYQQREYRREHQSWAANLKQLGMDEPTPFRRQHAVPQIMLRGRQYKARVTWQDDGGATHAWTISHDGRLARTGEPDMASLDLALNAVLQRQVEAWNRGDLQGFLAGYWRSRNLTMSSGGTLTQGFWKIEERYQKRYPDAARMGRLTLEDLDHTLLGPEAVLTRGRWKLARQEQPLQGVFTLVFRQIDGRWKIVHDHTSVTD